MDAESPGAKDGGRAGDKPPTFARRKRVRVTAEESLKRTEDFHLRREKFIAAIRKGKD